MQKKSSSCVVTLLLLFSALFEEILRKSLKLRGHSQLSDLQYKDRSPGMMTILPLAWKKKTEEVNITLSPPLILRKTMAFSKLSDWEFHLYLFWCFSVILRAMRLAIIGLSEYWLHHWPSWWLSRQMDEFWPVECRWSLGFWNEGQMCEHRGKLIPVPPASWWEEDPPIQSCPGH